MPVLDPARPPRLQGEALAAAYTDYFTSVDYALTNPDDEGVLACVNDAANRITMGLGPYVRHAHTGARAFTELFINKFGVLAGWETEDSMQALMRAAQSKVILNPVKAYAMAPIEADDRSCALRAGKHFDLQPRDIAVSIKNARIQLHNELDMTLIRFGLDEQDLKRRAKQALVSIGRGHWWQAL